MNEHLSELVNKSIFILRETKVQFKHPCVLWSTGKDSTAMLSLIKESFFGEVPWDVVHIDTGWKFPEMYEFRNKITKEWNLPLVVAESPQAGKLNPTKGTEHKDCCQKLKTDVLRNIIEEKGYDVAVVSIRRDEHYIRNMERVSSPRDKKFRWRLLRKKKEGEGGDAPFESLQDVELWNIYQSDFGDIHHVRRHPILHWTELDVWEYVKEKELPVNPLYFSRNGFRYRSLGCQTCTNPVKSDASTIDEIVKELKTTKVSERSGRAQDKEKEQVMRRLRALGYM